jgi:hypothetical protein
MSDTKDLKLTFTGVAVRDQNLVVVTTMRGDVQGSDIDHELVFLFENQEWTVVDAEDKNIVSATFDRDADAVILLSADGFVLRVYSKRTLRSEIDATDDGPSDLVQMRQIRRLGNAELVVGMARRVYERRGKATKWSAIDEGCFVTRDKRRSAIGFNGIDGWSADRQVAVGYKGEIWLRDKKKWRQLSSPTVVTLTAVACSTSKINFVAVGVAGTIVLGSSDKTHVLKPNKPVGDLWSVVHFNGSYYAASDRAVFKLHGPSVAEFKIEEIKLASRGKPTTGYLSANDAEMWSVGEKDIFSTRDGKTWNRVPNP